MHIYSILYSIYSIFSSKLTFKSWILTSEKKGPSCPNWGKEGGYVIRAMPERKRFFFSIDPFPFMFPIILLKNFMSVREDINWKKTFSFGHCPNYLNPPPMTPIRATWSSFFGSQNSRFESQFRTDDDDSYFLNCKTKAQFDIYSLMASTFSPNGPYSSTESKLDIYKRRKLQRKINFPFLVPSLTQ